MINQTLYNMKKLILSALFVSASLFAAQAQVSGGLKAGLNFADQKWSFGNISLDTDSRTGFHVGGYLNLSLAGAISIQPELIYSAQGGRFTGDGEDVTLAVDYLNLPIMLRYNINDMINIQAGPQFGYLLSANGKADGQSDDISEMYKPLDVALGVGAGIELPMGLTASVRYNLGLSNIADTEDGEDFTIKNNVIQISVGFRLFGN
jgi:hypothetical protein